MWQLLTQSPVVERAGWLLVHSLWQFAIVAILAIVLQRATRRRSAVLRYRTLLATMLLLVAMPVVTWFQLSPPGPPAAMAEIQSVETLPPVPPPRAAFAPGNGPHMHPAEAASVRLAGKTAAQRAEPTLPQHVSGRSAWALPQLEQRLHPWLPAIVLVWLAGACLAALRPLWGWYTARRLRTTGVTRVPDAMHVILERTARRLKLDQTVELLQSAWVQSPAVVGYLRPVILLPVCVVTGLPESELELILAHELAHIRRHDYLVNLLQTLAETLFFYHPAVWWLSRQIRNERENCCDDVAMDIAGSRADYARALLAVEELRAVPSRFAVAAGGGSLLARIRRIAGREPAPRATGGASILCLVLVSLGLGIAVTWGVAPAEEKSKPAAAAVTAPNVAGKNAGKPSAAGPLGPQTAALERRAVHKRIKDFPDKVDLSKAKLTLESLGFASSQSDPGYDGEIDKLIKQKKYTLLKTFESKDGRKQYAYRFTAANGRQVNRNFSMPLDHVDSWADYQAKRQRQDAERNERISQALTSGRFRLVNLEVMQVHLCRDVASGMEFKVQRIQLSDGTETALPRADYGQIPPSVKQTKWQDHVEAIRDGKRELLNLETVNSYTYEMTADDGTKVIFHYGGNDPLDALVKRAAPVEPGVKTARSTETRSGETVLGVRPQGNCSISGRVISEANGKPVAGAHMYLHYSATHGSIFVNTDGDGKFEIKNIPTGPFSLCSSFTPGYQDAAYSPQGQPGRFPQFSLKDGEHRSGIVLKIKPACRISGRILDENGRAPDSKTWNVVAWVKNDYGDGYHSQHGFINRRDGSYKIDGLAQQPVYVMAINWRAAREGNASPPVYYPGVFSRGDAKQVTFDRSPHVDGVDITLRKQGGLILEGTVRDEAGHPIPEAFVVVHRRDLSFDFNTAYTDAQGHYRIHGLGAGELMIHVDAAHRGFVRTRAPIVLDKSGQNMRRDFTLHRGVLISGRFTDEQGRPWQIGESYAYAAQISQDRPARTQFELNEGDFSLTEFQNKYRPKNVARAFPGTFLHGEGDYDCDQAIFPTANTFLIQGLMPGHTLVGLSPNKERQKVVKILYQGRDVRTCGIDTQPGQEIKDVTVVVGQDP
jgi:beta-lactamase regulating signal transducer with metallopeptidase domain